MRLNNDIILSTCELSIDIDECGSNPCEHNGSCNDVVNGFQCDCQNGYSGTKCETGENIGILCIWFNVWDNDDDNKKIIYFS